MQSAARTRFRVARVDESPENGGVLADLGGREIGVFKTALGLAPLVASWLIAMMRTLADEHGVGVLLVEQFAALALQAGDHAHVLSQGRIVYAGSPRPLIEHPDIRHRAYLGESV